MFRRFFSQRPTGKEVVVESTKFNLWQKVWIMINNQPREVRIVQVKVRGVYDQFMRECHPQTSYLVSENGNYEAYYGQKVSECNLYSTRQELVDSLKGEDDED